jgi:DHA2 family multidrug resistance protein-like MFS transporter
MGAGTGPLVALGTNLVVSSVPPERAGSAAGLAQTGNELGYALGIATLGSLGTFVYRTVIADSIPAGIPAAAAHAARDTLTGAAAAVQHLPNDLAERLLAPAREAFTVGLHSVAWVAAVVLAGVALLIATSLRHLAPIGQSPSQEAEGITSRDVDGEPQDGDANEIATGAELAS